MNSKPTGEWTAEYVRDLQQSRGYITSETGWKAIADAHKAAIAAEREKWQSAMKEWQYSLKVKQDQLAVVEKVRDDWADEYVKVRDELKAAAEYVINLNKQLAAEKEKYLHEARAWFDRDEQLREQLAAEREKLESVIDEEIAKNNQLEEQVKESQEEAYAAYAEVDAIREQLAAEREKLAAAQSGNKAAKAFMDYLRANTGVSDEWPIELKVAEDSIEPINTLLNQFEKAIYATDTDALDAYVEKQLAAEQRNAEKAAARAELAQIALAVERDINGCAFAGPGRGDCEHFVGYPSPIHNPNVHDGPDDTVDAYGKPNGWCWSCWKSRQIQQLREQLAAERERSEDALKLYEQCVDKLVATQVALKRMQGAAMDELPAEVQRIGDEALAKTK